MTGEGGRRRRRALAALATFSALAGGVWGAAEAATPIAYPTFASTAGLDLNGDAVRVGNTIQLTEASSSPPATTSIGSVFTESRGVRLERSFKTTFTYFSTAAEDVPGDGFALVVHGRASSRLGAEDIEIGYGGIAPSVAVEFDMTADGSGGPHAAIVKNGDPATQVRSGFVPVYSTPLTAKVAYKARRHRVEVYAAMTGEPLPADPIVSRRINLRRLIGRRARAGFTGTSGIGGTADQELRSWTLKQPR